MCPTAGVYFAKQGTQAFLNNFFTLSPNNFQLLDQYFKWCAQSLLHLFVHVGTWMEAWFVLTVNQRKCSWLKTQLLLKGGISLRKLGWLEVSTDYFTPLWLNCTFWFFSLQWVLSIHVSYSFPPFHTSLNAFLTFLDRKGKIPSTLLRKLKRSKGNSLIFLVLQLLF